MAERAEAYIVKKKNSVKNAEVAQVLQTLEKSFQKKLVIFCFVFNF